MDKRIGQQLGNYRLTKLLGSGGFGDVYLGTHVNLSNYEVAIKILPYRLPETDIKHFQLEADVLAQLSHPNIIRILDFQTSPRSSFIIMQYASRGSLRQQHPNGTRLTLPLILQYLQPLAAALQYAHDRQIIHRDIKPDNILLGAHNELLLSDFGTAILTRSARSKSVTDIIGTATYMAPEQFQGRPERASDQYSLAILLYEWLIGHPPFHGNNMLQLGQQHVQAPVPPLRQKSFMIPQSIEQVVMKALAKKPLDRFASIEEFARSFSLAVKHAIRDAADPTMRG